MVPALSRTSGSAKNKELNSMTSRVPGIILAGALLAGPAAILIRAQDHMANQKMKDDKMMDKHNMSPNKKKTTKPMKMTDADKMSGHRMSGDKMDKKQ
jgi:hypothetical protein